MAFMNSCLNTTTATVTARGFAIYKSNVLRSKLIGSARVEATKGRSKGEIGHDV